jgi:predicted RNA binding protein YcfA (HicA-like mRNA interferase family)
VKALQRAGFEVRCQTGSHIILSQKDPYKVVSVPNHKELNKSTLKSILRDAGLTVDEPIELL